MTVQRSQHWRSRARSVAQALTGRPGWHRKADVQIVRASTLFDGDWYLQSYPDVAQAGIDPLIHYLASGWREGRDPGPEFATSAYLHANPDVAQLGVNPLVHYIEHGYAEGRSVGGHRPVFADYESDAFDFDEATAVSSFAISTQAMGPWVSSYRVDLSRPDSLAIEDIGLGYTKDSTTRTTIDAGVKLLEAISGEVPLGAERSTFELNGSDHRLVDAWYVNDAQLRVRWSANGGSFVVRVLQHDPRSGGLSLAADNFIASELDILDVHLNNAFFPLLFIFCRPDGTVHGCRLLAFPCLCRGGTHYAELLALARGQFASIDVLGQSDHLTRRLLELKGGRACPAIAHVDVDLSAADGSAPLFQPDFQMWLTSVAGVSISPVSKTADAQPGKFLENAISREVSKSWRQNGSRLVLKHDMVPTISALTEAEAEVEAETEASKTASQVLPLLVAGPDHTQPSYLIELPKNAARILDHTPGDPGSWPRLIAPRASTSTENYPLGAIRLFQTGLSGAQLVGPLTGIGTFHPDNDRPPLTWLIEADGWETVALCEGLECLASQLGGDDDCLAFLGAPNAVALATAKRLFGDRVSRSESLGVAAAALDTRLAAFVGSEVVLHDPSWAAVMSTAMTNECIASASSVLIRIDRRGAVSHPTVVNVGLALESVGGELDGSEDASLKQLWRSVFPIGAPPLNLWLARSADLAHWTGQAGRADQIDRLHLCSFFVTASYYGGGFGSSRSYFFPRSAKQHVTKIEALVG